MDLFDQINQDMKEAMKAKQKEKLSALRAIKSELMLVKTKKGDAKISEADGLKILQKLAKQRKDSAETFVQGGRQDLADQELVEVPYIEAYLPQQMDEKAIEEAIAKIIADTGASSMKEMGKVMGMATKQLAGKADNKTVAQKVKELLS